jgi:Subtilase family/Secretion system C-terminal sorting domain/PKD domain
MKLRLFWSFMFVLVLSFHTMAQSYVTGKVWVKFKPSAYLQLPTIDSEKDRNALADFPEIAAITQDYGLYKLHKAFGLKDPLLNDIYTFWIKDDAHAHDFARRMAMLPVVEYVERAPLDKLDYFPNDYNQTAPNIHWHLARIFAPQAWDLTKGDPSVTIAIVDDAVVSTHQDLQTNIWQNPAELNGIPGFDDDNNGYIDDIRGWDTGENDNDATPDVMYCGSSYAGCHGSSVAHSASGDTDNGKGIPSIGFRCKMIPVKISALDALDTPRIVAGYEGIAYAASLKAKVINMSWGNTQFTQTGQNVVTAAHNAGCVLVASAGNDNNAVNHYPSNYKYVISVAASYLTTSNPQKDKKAGFSCYHDSVDVSAPGQQIRVAKPDGVTTYQNIDGTSFSSPITAGLCGLMLSLNPCLTPEEVEYHLEQTCDSFPDMALPLYLGKLGAGRINAFHALQAILPSTAPAATFTPTVNPCNMNVSYTYNSAMSSACPATYQWSFPGATPTSSNTPNPIVAYPAPGNYMAYLTVSNVMGTAIDSQVIVVTSTPSPTVNAGADTVNCYGKQIQLNANSPSGSVSYQWTPNIAISSPLVPNPLVTLTTDRNYIVTVTDANGCQGKDTINVSVDPSLGPIVNAGTDITGCYGDVIQVFTTTSNPNVTYQWTPIIGILSASAANPSFSLTQTRIYVVTVTDANQCKDIDSLTINVGLAPTISAGIDQTANNGATVQLNAYCPTCATLSWTPSAGLSNPAIANPTFTATATTTFTVEGKTASGCAKTDQVVITVWGVAIDDLVGNNVTITPAYPNPSANEMNVHADFAQKGSLNLALYDINGKKVQTILENEVVSGAFDYLIHKNNLTSGVYLLVWEFNNERLVQKINFE